MSWDIRGKTVLITGGTSGIGLEAAVQLAKKGAVVAIVGRDRAKTEACAAEIVSRGGGGAVQTFLCDFSSQKSIRALAEAVRAGLPRIDVLVNNAGGVHKARRVSEDGIEMTFAVNHLGYFLFTNLVLDIVVRSAPSRIVSVASVAHRRGTLDFEDLGFSKGGYSITAAYSRSKLANVLFASELSRRLAGKGVTSNSLHPGSVATNIWSGAPLWAKPIIFLALRPFFLSAEEGGETIVRLVAEPSMDGVTGQYFEGKEASVPAPLGTDEGAAKRLWDASAKMVSLPG
jgi:NAD(P)-dependent dehydrogenase (short-subunit alcohol dehydrogenase family)